MLGRAGRRRARECRIWRRETGELVETQRKPQWDRETSRFRAKKKKKKRSKKGATRGLARGSPILVLLSPKHA